jgi:hypothetical protein
VFREVMPFTLPILVSVFGITGCDHGARVLVPAANRTTAIDVAKLAPGASDSDLCDQSRSVIGIVHALQRAQFPADRNAAAQRIANFAQAAPREIQAAARDLTGSAVIAMRQSGGQSAIVAAAVNGDLAVMDNWRSSHC